MSAGSPKPKEPTVALLPGTSASSVTFVISEEDHTLGNALRYAIARNPAVTFCGYSVPHPSEERINLRVQASGPGGAEAAFRRGLSDLSEIVDHIKSTFVAALDTQEVAGGGGGGAGAAAAAAVAAMHFQEDEEEEAAAAAAGGAAAAAAAAAAVESESACSAQLFTLFLQAPASARAAIACSLTTHTSASPASSRSSRRRGGWRARPA